MTTGAAGVVAALLAGDAPAQGTARTQVSAADRAIARGQLEDAERTLYAAVARAPRQPSARGALGAFLASRGKLLVGATLLDEALQFGADTGAIQRRQLEVYRWAGAYARMAELHAVPLASGAREALRRAATAVPGGAAIAEVELAPADSLTLGRITVSVAGVRSDVDVEPIADGVVLGASDSLRSVVAVTGTRGDTTFGVVQALTIGAVTLGPLPVTLVAGVGVGYIGLDVLSLLTPTFDQGAGTLTVRSARAMPRGNRMAALLTFPGVSFVTRAGRAPVGVHTHGGLVALGRVRWTLDAGEGVIVVEATRRRP